ncbi:MAG: YgfZ/GcvT domain-containing protein [Candidatus Acidiferrales bacterium]
METPLITVHRESGVKLAEFSGCLLPERFSSFESEYRAGHESVALFDTNWHAVLTLAGPDRVRYLNAMVTNNIQSLAEGRGVLALLLNPQGHILAELEVFNQPGHLLTRSHASVRERTVSTLDKYIIMDNVDLEDITEEVGSIAIEGPRAAVIVQQACGFALEDLPEMAIHEAKIERIPCQFLRRSHFGQPGAEFVVRRDRLPSLWNKLLAGVQAHGGEPIGMHALNTLRLEAGIPWFPEDFNESVIPHEAGLENTHINFTKGCYTGQEIVERVRSRGHVNRRLVTLRFTIAGALPAPGTKLRAAGTEVGHITSSAYLPSEGVAIGMGYVRREHNAPGTALEFDGGTASVEAAP